MSNVRTSIAPQVGNCGNISARTADFACGEHRKLLDGFEVERNILNFLGGTE